jgi:hypothetical protein
MSTYVILHNLLATSCNLLGVFFVTSIKSTSCTALTRRTLHKITVLCLSLSLSPSLSFSLSLSHTHTHTKHNRTSAQCIFKCNIAAINCQGQLHTRQSVTVVPTDVVRSKVSSSALLDDLWCWVYKEGAVICCYAALQLWENTFCSLRWIIFGCHEKFSNVS